ncbi:MAG: hypothetical protein AAF553_03200 [Pseudomonadota bacterium]
MTSADVTQDLSPVEAIVGEELARADRALASVAPVLGHLLANSGNALVSDAIVARVRGMLNDLAHQLTSRLLTSEDPNDTEQADALDTLSDQLAADTAILTYLHAAAMESLLAERLYQAASIDPVLTPLWQELVASQDVGTGETAMQALAAQSRFLQAQSRMQHPLDELPADVLERALRIWVRATPVDREPEVSAAMRAIKLDYDEAETRLGLIARLVGTMRSGIIAALEIEHAGLALFASALAQRSGQTRDRAILACHENQAMRMAVSLRAAGLEGMAVERQLVIFGPNVGVSTKVGRLSVEGARDLLSVSQLEASNLGLAERSL